MTKYIDAEKLRKLLANRYEEITVPVLTDEGGLESFYRRSEIHNILKIVDSLQQEQPSEDLNDEIKKFIEEYGYERGEDKLLIAIVARHFAEWQREQMLKDAVEGKVFMSFAPGHNQMVMADVDLPTNTKVKLIIVKEEKK